jgi:hypothetical protein
MAPSVHVRVPKVAVPVVNDRDADDASGWAGTVTGRFGCGGTVSNPNPLWTQALFLTKARSAPVSRAAPACAGSARTAVTLHAHAAMAATVSDCTVLGMPLDVAEDDEICTVQPLCAFVVVKALDQDGEIRYLTGATGGLQSVECLGMAEYAALRLRRGMWHRLGDYDGGE